MNYEVGEHLILTGKVKNIKGDTIFNRGDVVEFVQLIKADDLSQCLVAVRPEGSNIVTLVKESLLKPKDTSKLKKAKKNIVISIEKKYPRLRMNNPNFFKRNFYKLYYYIVDFFKRK